MKNRLAKIVSSDPFLWGACGLPARVLGKLKDRAAARMLRAPGIHLGPGCVIRGARNISFGRGVFATRNLWLEAVLHYLDQSFAPVIKIGDGVAFSDGVHITAIEHICIGDRVLMGSRIYISDHNHGLYKGVAQSRPDEPPARRRLGGGGPVVIGNDAWIGDNVVIVGPITIGAGAVIGANSVVRSDIAPQTIAVGAPARPVKRFNLPTQTWDRI
jgi:lipopolysaccharide O-acetyltransferase